MDYKQLLEYSFEIERETNEWPLKKRIAYLSRNIFNFTTYDSSIDEIFGKRAVEICAAITNRTTFDYIKSQDNYEWFLLMCNMPFFASKIEWGTSIRGAWWQAPPGKQIELESCGLWISAEQMVDAMRFSDEEWRKFIIVVVEFAAPEMN